MTLLLALVAVGMARAQALPENAAVPGGVAVLRVADVAQGAPSAWFQERRVLVSKRDDGWYALVGLPLDLKPGDYELRVKARVAGKASDASQRFSVTDKTYPRQDVTITDKRKVEPSKQDLERIKREQAIIAEVKRHWREVAEVDTLVQLPVDGRLSSRFGLRRYFNGQPRAPHSGLDVAVPSGTPVQAAAGGRVVNVGDYFFNGKTVFLDHGQGFITMYCHLSEIGVKVGDALARGQTLGLSGMTGRASGPHLHWSVILNGTLIDPEVFVRAP